MVPPPFLSVFLAYPSFVFSVRLSLHAALLFLHPLSDRSLLLRGFAASLAVPLLRSAFFFFCVHRSYLRCFVSCFLPSDYVCSLVTCFAFLCVFSPSLCSVLSRSSCPLALYFIPTVLLLLCFPDFVSRFLFVCILLVIVSSTFSCLFLFSMLSVVSGVSVLRLLSFPWGFSPAFRAPLLFFVLPK